MPELFGKYKLEKLLATGGMAEVFLARVQGESGFEKELVIKRILPHLNRNRQFVEMFIQEAKIAALLVHSNITQVFDFGSIDNHHYIAMEYVEGMDLNRILNLTRNQSIKLEPHLAAFICAQAAAGLAYAHKKKLKGKPLNIIHRDISPQNILISFHGEVKVTDFGIAKTFFSTSYTETGQVRGKISYMAPEQARGEEMDMRSDIYSLGLVLWEMLTNQKAVQANFRAEAMQHVQTPSVNPPSTFNPDLGSLWDNVTTKALAPKKEMRFQGMDEFKTNISQNMTTLGFYPDNSELAIFINKLAQMPEPARETLSMAVDMEKSSQSDSKNSKDKKILPLKKLLPAMLLLIAATLAINFHHFSLAPKKEPQTTGQEIIPVESKNTRLPPEIQISPGTQLFQRKKIGKSRTAPGAKGSILPMGQVNFDIWPWGQVFLKGKLLVEAPAKGVMLPPGHYRFLIINPAMKKKRWVNLKVEKGKTKTIKHQFEKLR